MRATVALLHVQAVCCLLQGLLIHFSPESCTSIPAPVCVDSSLSNQTDFLPHVLQCHQIDLTVAGTCLNSECGRFERLGQLFFFNFVFCGVWSVLYCIAPKYTLSTALIYAFVEVLGRGWLILETWHLHAEWYEPWNLTFQPAFPMSAIFVVLIHMVSCLSSFLAFYLDQSAIQLVFSRGLGVYSLAQEEEEKGVRTGPTPVQTTLDVDVSHA